MSEELLWYGARVSGLMAWMLACAALASGLLVRSQRRVTPAGLWARDTYRFLGLASLVFLVAHVATVVAGSMVDVSAVAAVSGRSSGGWLGWGLLLGTVAAWALVIGQAIREREAERRRAVSLGVLAPVATAVALGGVHGWRVGSDVGNPVSLAILAVFTTMVAAVAALSLRAVPAGPVWGARIGADWAAGSTVAGRPEAEAEPARGRQPLAIPPAPVIASARRIQAPVPPGTDRSTSGESADDRPVPPPPEHRRRPPGTTL